MVTRTRSVWCLALVVAVAMFAGACGRSDDDSGGGGGGGGGGKASPGITDKEIKLGGSYPFSGPASAYRSIADGAKAYFAFTNAKGGVDGARSPSRPTTTRTSRRRRCRTRAG